jgi:hypothetical protein
MPAATKAPAKRAASKRTAAQRNSETAQVESSEDVAVPENNGHSTNGATKLNGVASTKPPKGMYPDDTELFAFTPQSTNETIWFPKLFKQPDAVTAWELYDKPFHVQTWEWMKWAEIPRAMQRKAVELLDKSPDEYIELFNAWMQQAGGVSLGE